MVGTQILVARSVAWHHALVGLIRLKLGAPWLENGTLVRLYGHDVPSPHAHYLC